MLSGGFSRNILFFGIWLFLMIGLGAILFKNGLSNFSILEIIIVSSFTFLSNFLIFQCAILIKNSDWIVSSILYLMLVFALTCIYYGVIILAGISNLDQRMLFLIDKIFISLAGLTLGLYGIILSLKIIYEARSILNIGLFIYLFVTGISMTIYFFIIDALIGLARSMDRF
jgi:hypothetical protein